MPGVGGVRSGSGVDSGFIEVRCILRVEIAYGALCQYPHACCPAEMQLFISLMLVSDKVHLLSTTCMLQQLASGSLIRPR